MTSIVSVAFLALIYVFGVVLAIGWAPLTIMPTSQGGYDQFCVALVLLTADFTEITDQIYFTTFIYLHYIPSFRPTLNM